MKRQLCDNKRWRNRKPDENIRKGFKRLLQLQRDLCFELDRSKGIGLMRAIDNAPGCTNTKIRLIREMVEAMHAELEELKDWTPWKSWKDYKDYNLEDNLVEMKFEIVDILHFLLETMLLVGMDEVELAKVFTEKHEQNKERQANGY